MLHPDPFASDAPLGPVPVDDAVAAALFAIDRETAAFASSTGLGCPDGCGACCHSPHVEATTTELVPLARVLVAEGRAAETLARIEAHRAAGDGRCVLFAPEGDDPVRGRCTAYAWRPSACRLFGFAGRRGPEGEPRFTACRRHAETMPEVVREAEDAVKRGTIALPVCSDLAGAVLAAAGPAPLRPINDALASALSAEALRVRLAGEAGEAGGAEDDGRGRDGEDDDRDRRPPARPPRLRPAA